MPCFKREPRVTRRHRGRALAGIRRCIWHRFYDPSRKVGVRLFTFRHTLAFLKQGACAASKGNAL